MNQAKTFLYKPIGKFEKSRQYQQTQFILGPSVIEDTSSRLELKKKEQSLLTEEERFKILKDMTSKHIYFGHDSYMPKEGSNNQTYKHDSSFDKQDLLS